MRIDVVELLALTILVVAVFVAARTWGRASPPACLAVLALATVQVLWVLDVLPPPGQFSARGWAAIACGMLIVLGFGLAQFGLKGRSPFAALVSLAAALELLVLTGTLRLG